MAFNIQDHIDKIKNQTESPKDSLKADSSLTISTYPDGSITSGSMPYGSVPHEPYWHWNSAPSQPPPFAGPPSNLPNSWPKIGVQGTNHPWPHIPSTLRGTQPEDLLNIDIEYINHLLDTVIKVPLIGNAREGYVELLSQTRDKCKELHKLKLYNSMIDTVNRCGYIILEVGIEKFLPVGELCNAIEHYEPLNTYLSFNKFLGYKEIWQIGDYARHRSQDHLILLTQKRLYDRLRKEFPKLATCSDFTYYMKYRDYALESSRNDLETLQSKLNKVEEMVEGKTKK